MESHVTREGSRRFLILLKKFPKMAEFTTGQTLTNGWRDFLGDLEEHRMTVPEICAKFDTDSCFGLTRSTAEAHLARDGKNIIFPKKGDYNFARFLSYMFCGVSLIFLIMTFISMICLILENFTQSETVYSIWPILVFSVLYVSFVGAFYYFQSKIENFSEMSPGLNHKVEVIRDGKKATLPAEEIVVGDLIMLRFGEVIPADIFIIESQNFNVSNQVLTGMVHPQQMNEKMKEKNSWEDPHIALFSGTVVEGTARGIVIRTGKQTLLGQIVGSRKTEDIFISPIIRKIRNALNSLTVAAVILAIILFVVFLFTTRGERLIDALMMSTTLIMGIILENLFLVTVIVLHVFGQRLFLKNYRIRNFRAIQRLPFVKTICLDQPGVLTLNKAIVSNLWFDGKRVEVWGGSKISARERSSSTFKELALCAVLCSEARFKEKDDQMPITKRQVTGRSDEVAILRFIAVTVGKRMEGWRELYPKLLRGSYTKFQLSIHRMEDELLIILIGDPDILMEKCSNYAFTGNNEPINDEFIRRLDKACVQFAKNGETLKCVIEQRIRLSQEEHFDKQRFKLPETGYKFIGLVTLSDTPRANISQTIAKCREAGIKVILTTNDHPITAKTFARNIGLITEGSKTAEERLEEGNEDKRNIRAIVVDCMQLNKISKKGMEKLIEKYSEVVFARVNALQKLMLVDICQQENTVVAVIGDGIQDALIMKKADLGIALSNDGNEPVADVCLTDDTFSSLITCIEEGRTIYENLKKTSCYLLAGVLPTILPVVAYCVFGLPLPINFSNLVILQYILELFPAFALMLEKPDPDAMKRPPRKLTDPIWCRQMFFYAFTLIGMIETFACFFSYFVVMLEYGWSPFRLIGIRDYWDSKWSSDLEDDFGQRWVYEAREILQFTSQTVYFFTFLSVQCANVLECRNQRISLFRVRDRNWMVHFSLLIQMSLTFLFIYIPRVNTFVNLQPLKPVWWLLPTPFFCLIILFDELKKYITHKYPQGWLARETLY